MTRLILQVLFLIVTVVTLTACQEIRGAWIWQTQMCKDIFRREPPENGAPVDDSVPPPRHTPPEAQNSIISFVDFPNNRNPEIVQRYSLTCLSDLEVLSTETLEEGPASNYGVARLSPSSQLLAMGICCGEDSRIEIIDLITGSQQQVSASPGKDEMPIFWGSESEVFLWVENPDHILRRDIVRLNIDTGERVSYTSLQHYNGPDLKVLAGELYTGWQVVGELNVDLHDICIAVQDKLFTPVYAADGTILIRRDELLKEGANIVAQDDPYYVTREMIVEMMNRATNLRAVRSVSYEGNYWIIMEGLPRLNRQVVISTRDETLVTNIPLVENGVNVIWDRGVRYPDIHPLFFMAPNLCQIEGGYQSVLYRKGQNGMPPVALGIPPYPQSGGAGAIWSPDGKYIYIDQWSGGRYSVSRLDLTEFMVEE